jgi:hypothetical protein
MKIEREFFDPGSLPWRPAPGFLGGVWEQVISGGADEGVTTRLLPFDPGSGNDRVVRTWTVQDLQLRRPRHAPLAPEQPKTIPGFEGPSFYVLSST